MSEETINSRKVHEEDKRYKCDSCDITFKDTQELHLHIRDVHKGSKNYLCDMCDEGFWQMSSLELHITRVRPDHFFHDLRSLMIILLNHDLRSLTVIF